jgi:hypothetical protein
MILGDLQNNEYSWALEDVVASWPLKDGQKIVDVDSVDGRLFILLDNLILLEASIESKEVVRQVNLAELEGASEFCVDQKATSFSMFKDVSMIGVSSQKNVLLFDYENDLSFELNIPIANAFFLTFVEVYVIVAAENQETEETEILCFELGSEEPEGRIAIKQFLGQRLIVRPGEKSVYFATGSQIGRIAVPEMEVMFQEDTGHEVLDFACHDTAVFTTGKDMSLRLFDSDQGTMLIEPMEDMEVDSVAL